MTDETPTRVNEVRLIRTAVDRCVDDREADQAAKANEPLSSRQR